MKNLSEPVLSRVTAKNRLLSVAGPFTKGIFKDTREQAERLYRALLVQGAKVEMTGENVGEPNGKFGSISQFVNVTACGHVFKLVCVHALCDIGTDRAYGDLCFYTV